MRNAMKKDVNYATLHPSSASVIDLSSLQKVYSSSSLLDIEHSDHDIHSECDGVEARSQYSAITSSTMFVRIAPWLEEEKPLLPHQEAAILLEYARDGQDLNGSKLTLRSRLCYRLRHKFQWLFRLTAWGLLTVHIFERPMWSYRTSGVQEWHNTRNYPAFGVPYLPQVAVTTLTGIFLFTLWMAVGMEFGYKAGTSYSYLPYISAAVLLAKSIDVLIEVVYLCIDQPPLFSVSPVEALMCLLVELQFDNNMGYLLRTMPKFSALMLALGVSICCYTALGMLIINPSSNKAQEYFPNFSTAVWTMLTVLNGSNWPGPMIPLFNTSRTYCLYFYAYIIFVGWGLLNLVLGFNYLFFQQEQKSIFDMQEKTRIDNRAAAFSIMDVENKGFLTYAQVDDLLQEMYEFYEELYDGPSAAERYEMILVLDIQSNLMIDENDFSFIEEKCFQGALRRMRSKKRKFTRFVSANIIDKQSRRLRTTSATGHELELIRRDSIIEHASKYAGRIADPKLLDLYRSIEVKQYLSLNSRRRPTFTQWLAYYSMQLDTIYFDILFDTLAVVLGITLLFNSRVAGLIYTYVALCLCEALIKWFIKGSYRYLNSTRNTWDGSIALVLTIVVVVEASTYTRPGYTHVIVKLMVLLRTLLFPRNILVTNGFKAFRSRHRLAFKYAFKSAEHFSFLLLVLVVMLYIFAGVGQDLFGGAICYSCAQAASIANSLYGETEYYSLNFNDMPSGMVTMFTLLSVNNMHITASGFVAAYSQWALVFFASWYALGVLLLLNVVTAVFLDQFTGYLRRLAEEKQRETAAKMDMAAQLLSNETAAEARDRGSTNDQGSVGGSGGSTNGDKIEIEQYVPSRALQPIKKEVEDTAAPLPSPILQVLPSDTETYLIDSHSSVQPPQETQEMREGEQASPTPVLTTRCDGAIRSPQSTAPTARDETARSDGSMLDTACSAATSRAAHNTATSVVPPTRPPVGRMRWISDSTESNTNAQQRHRSESQSNTTLSSGLGMLMRMLSVEDTPDVELIDEVESATGFQLSPPYLKQRSLSADHDSLPTPLSRKDSGGSVAGSPRSPQHFDIASLSTSRLHSDSHEYSNVDNCESSDGDDEEYVPVLAHRSSAAAGPGRRTGVADDTMSPDAVAFLRDQRHLSQSRGRTTSADIADLDHFSESIFASGTERKRLSGWVNAQTPRLRLNSDAAAAVSGDGGGHMQLQPASGGGIGSPSPHTRLREFAAAGHKMRRSGFDLNYVEDDTPVVGSPRSPLSPLAAGGWRADADIASNMRPNGAAALRAVDLDDATPAAGFQPSIFSSEADRRKLSEWVTSQQPRNRPRGVSAGSQEALPATVTSGASSSFRRRTHSADNTNALAQENSARAPHVIAPTFSLDSGQEFITSDYRSIAQPGPTVAAVMEDEAQSSHPSSSKSNVLFNSLPNPNPNPHAHMDETGPSTGDVETGVAEDNVWEEGAFFLKSVNALTWWDILSGSTGQLSLPERAAVLILFAREGHERSEFRTPRALWCFRVRNSLSPYLKLSSVLLVLVKFIHRPLWTYYRQDDWDVNAVYPSSGMPQISHMITGAMRLPLLLFLLFGIMLELTYNEFPPGYFMQQLTQMRVARYTLFSYGVAQVLMILIGLGGGPPQLIPVTSFACILYVLWFNRPALRKLQIILEVVPRLGVVIFSAVVMIFAFAGFGPYLFNIENVGVEDDAHQEYFGTFGTATWSIFVAITSSNYPNQILPAYSDNRTFFLYFFGFMALGAFVLLNVILATVFVEFQRATQLAADIERASRQVLLMRAFEVLDPEGKGYIARAHIRLLLDELYLHYSAFQGLGESTDPSREIVLEILDVDCNGKVTMDDFLFFLAVTRVKLFVAVAPPTFVEKYFPNLVRSTLFQHLRAVVLWRYFSLTVGTFVVLLIILLLSLNSENLYERSTSSSVISALIVCTLVVETILKLVVRGYQVYTSSLRTSLDFWITVGALIGLVGSLSTVSDTRAEGFTVFLRVMIMSRLFVYPRNVRYVFASSGLKRFTRLLRRVLKQTLTLGVAFLCISYLFASIGLICFGGAINKNPAYKHYDALMNSRYGHADYFGLNFNDFMSAWFTLFSCIHVSDFDLVTSGFTATTNHAAKLFFTVWYVVGVLLMLNILKSFFLGEFLSLFLIPPELDTTTGSSEESANDDSLKEEGELCPPDGAQASQLDGSNNNNIDSPGSPSATGAEVHRPTATTTVSSPKTKPKRFLSWAEGPVSAETEGEGRSVSPVAETERHLSSADLSSFGSPSPLKSTDLYHDGVRESREEGDIFGFGSAGSLVEGLLTSNLTIKKIKLASDGLGDDVLPVPLPLPLPDAEDNEQIRTTPVLFASTEKVKTLDSHEIEVLHRRINALSGQADASPEHI